MPGACQPGAFGRASRSTTGHPGRQWAQLPLSGTARALPGPVHFDGDVGVLGAVGYDNPCHLRRAARNVD